MAFTIAPTIAPNGSDRIATAPKTKAATDATNSNGNVGIMVSVPVYNGEPAERRWFLRGQIGLSQVFSDVGGQMQPI